MDKTERMITPLCLKLLLGLDGIEKGSRANCLLACEVRLSARCWGSKASPDLRGTAGATANQLSRRPGFPLVHLGFDRPKARAEVVEVDIWMIGQE